MLITGLFLLLALIHVLPAVAAVSPAQLSTLYGATPGDETMTTLLQHRAVLLGLVGLALAAAAFVPHLQWAALIGGVASMTFFIAVAAINGALSGPLQRIAIVDAAGLPVAITLALLLSRGGHT